MKVILKILLDKIPRIQMQMLIRFERMPKSLRMALQVIKSIMFDTGKKLI